MTLSENPLTRVALMASAIVVASCSGDDVRRIHYDNPYVAAERWYVNPQWRDQALTVENGERIANTPTAVWLERAGDVGGEGGRGNTLGDFTLEQHLDEAIEQRADLITLVLNHVSEDSCGKELQFNGAYQATSEGWEVYKEEFIAPLRQTLANSKYAHMSIVVIVEPDSWIHLLDSREACSEYSNDQSYGYTAAIRYAIQELTTLNNVYLYLDAAHPGYIGWNSDIEAHSMMVAGIVNGFDGLDARSLGDRLEGEDGASGRFEKLDTLIKEPPTNVVAPGWDAIDGFAMNVAGYTPIEEPSFPDPYFGENWETIHTAVFFDWNPSLDIQDFVASWMKGVQVYGAPDHFGVVVDTSRNGWGGADRPEVRIPTEIPDDMSLYVDDYRLDRRPHRLSWCNQEGAGLGERPVAAPSQGVDAYLWVKNPGESDGLSDEGFRPVVYSRKRGLVSMCEPDGVNLFAERVDTTAGIGVPTGAMEDAPYRGVWFEKGFQQLLLNAYPPLVDSDADLIE